MENWKKIGKKLLFPPIWVIVILTVFSTVALVSVFVKGWEMRPIAYGIYVLSFYTLTVLCIVCWRVIPGYYRAILSKMHDNRYIDRYMTDAVYKSNVGLYRSLGVNLLYVVVNALSAYVYQTHWFGIFAVYYAIIATMRFLLARYVMRHAIGDDYWGELKRARVCAYILLTLNLALSGAVIMMLYFDRGFQYQGVLIYVIALYTFYTTTTAVIDMVKFRKYKSPVMSVTKVIKMTSALFSMLFLETAMFAQFGAETPTEVKHIMIMLTGAGIGVAVAAMAIYMIVQTSKQIEQWKDNKEQC